MSKKSRGSRPASAIPAPPSPRSGVLRWLAPVVLVLATVAAFLPTLENGFVNFDDIENFLNNRSYRGLGLTHLRWMFTTVNLGGLIPLTWMTLGFDYLIWGMDPAGYHLTSLLLHALAALVFYFVLLRLLREAQDGSAADATARRLGALFGALIFSVHPLRVESVAWVTERRDVLSGLFCLLTVLAYLRAWDTRVGDRLGGKWYLASLGLFVCALLSKAMAITLPAVLVLLDFYPLRRLRLSFPDGLGAIARNLLVEKSPFGVLSLACVGLSLAAARDNDAMSSLSDVSLLDRLSLSVHSVAFYLWKTVAPVNLAIMYELPEKLDRTAWPFVVAWVVVLTITAVCLVLRHRLIALAVVWLAYLVMLAPVSGLVQAGRQMAADRYSYLPCLSWSVLCAAGFSWAWRRTAGPHGEPTRTRSLVMWTGVLIVLGLAALTWKQVGVWHDTETLWAHAVVAAPSGRAHENLGEVFQDRGQLTEAGAHFERLVQIRPRYGPGHLYLGAVRAQQGRTDEAMREYAEAARLMPTSAVPHYNMGLALMAQNRTAEAIEQYREAVKLVPNYPNAHSNLGMALAGQGRLDEGVQHLREALKLDPESAGIHSNLGLVLARQGRASEALQHLGKAVELDPGNAGIRNNLGVMLVHVGHYDDAVAQFREALASDPNLREAQVNLDDAMARSKQGTPKPR